MLKILSDPTVYPILEADLATSFGKLSANGATYSSGSRDDVFERADGGANVMLRPTRTAVALAIDWLEEGAVGAALRRLAGIAHGRGLERLPVQLSAAFDSSTLLSAPLVGSLACYTGDGSGVLTKTTLSHTRVGDEDLDVLDDGGRMTPTGDGVVGYVESAIGRGLYAGAAEDYNRAYSGWHPTSGSLNWTAGTAATVAWAPGRRSPYYAAGGAARVTGTAATAGDVSAYMVCSGGFSASDIARAVVYATGRGRVRLTVTNAIGSPTPQTGAWIDLEATTWKALEAPLLTFAGADTGVVLKIEHDAASAAPDYLVGPANVYLMSDSTAHPIPHPQDGTPATATRATDVVDITTSPPLGEFTLSAVCLWPDPARYFRLVEFLNSGSASFTLGAVDIAGTSQSFFASAGGLSASVSIPRATADSYAGQPCAVVLRVSGAGAKLTVATGGAVVGSGTDSAPSATWTVDAIRLGYLSRALGLQWVRLDSRRWTDDEVDEHAALFTNGGLRDLIARTAGRTFLLGYGLAPRAGRSDDLVGSLTLSEIDRDLDFVP